jgi:hypothetical protein
MATFTSDLITNLARRPLVLPQSTGEVVCQSAVVSVPVTHAADDIIKLNVLPANCVIVDFKLLLEELDAHATDTLTYDVGILDSAGTGLVSGSKLISAGVSDSDLLQSINVAEGMLNIGVDDEARTIAAKITYVAATKAAGTATGILTYRLAAYGA